MGYYDFPHTRNYDTDLGYLISQYLNLRDEVATLITQEQITYADPLQWDITKQYRKNTLVINGYNAYLSKAPVPSNIEITNSEYWVLVGDFIREFNEIRKSISTVNAGSSTTTPQELHINDLVWWNDTLYKCVNDMEEGSAFVIDVNVVQITLEDYIKELNSYYDSKLAEVDNKIDELDSNTTEKINNIEEELLLSETLHVLNPTRLYIDGVNGNDENDGSIEHPLKTIDKFFEIANSSKTGKVDIRCYVVRNGSYTVTKHSINHLTLHITGNTDSVELFFPTESDVKFYECHCNFNNIKISSPSATEIAFDGGSVALSNCTFNETVTFYSIQGNVTSCNIRTLRAFYSNLVIRQANITNTESNKSAYDFHNSIITLIGSSQNADLIEDGTTNAFVVGEYSDINFLITLRNAGGGKYYSGIKSTGCNIKILESIWNALKTRTVDGKGFISTNTSSTCEFINANNNNNVTSYNTVRFNTSNNKLEYYNQTTGNWTVITVS